ncbi:MAG: hypothetical protein QF790_00610 [Gammaproteobacteria bacterium]|jgi:hypothetical protein|nr:hypothetical protein [Gammaproteobacteria bacterium]MDP6615656.1 hypothetical protein [Gammaproteobacteria bacterium]MDP6694683.1 hypothetical protein [Gammaproteobacteria bacterium]MDP7041683.1 hypothetical protein [Gammaproteobacteria bacterium]
MADNKLVNFAANVEPEEAAPDNEEQPDLSESTEEAVPDQPEVIPLPVFLETAERGQVNRRFYADAVEITDRYSQLLEAYTVVVLMDSYTFIGEYDLNRIFSALNTQNPNADKNVLLVIVSRGGSIESAYQLSKLCRAKSKENLLLLFHEMQNLQQLLYRSGQMRFIWDPWVT